MKTCWDVLGIATTTDVEAIRQAYLSLLPAYHPESDPQGFKQLREAYESALRQTATPPVAEAVVDEDTSRINAVVAEFHELLGSDARRFQPSAWQRFIQKLNELPVSLVERVRWPLCATAWQNFPISYTCLQLLAERLSWQRLDCDAEMMDEDTLELFLYDIWHGDPFDLTLLSSLPAGIQVQTIHSYTALKNAFMHNPRFFSQMIAQHGAMIIPDDKRLLRRLLHWYSALAWYFPELLPIAWAWQEEEPESEDAHYYECAQRVFAGEGDSLAVELCAYWQQYPSTQADTLLLEWCFRHRPDNYSLLVLAVENREQQDDDGNPALYIPGGSTRTRLLWLRALHSGRLSPLSYRFVAHRLNHAAPAMDALSGRGAAGLCKNAQPTAVSRATGHSEY